MKTNRITTLLLSFLMLAAVLAACQQEQPEPTAVPDVPETVVEEPVTSEEPAPEETGGDQPAIEQPIARLNAVTDRPWTLVGSGDVANLTVVEAGFVATITFASDGSVNGSGGCNNFFGSYEADDQGNMTINSPLGMTMMACPEGGEQEAAYLGALETVTGYVVNDEGRLELLYSSGQPFEEKLVYTPGETPLESTTWRLESMGDPNEPVMVEGLPITAEFATESADANGGTLAGFSGCNNYTTSYTLDGNNITVGPVAGTRKACATGMEQESAYLAALQSAQTFEIVGSRLTITYDGGALSYSALNLPLENVLWTALVVAGEPVPEGVEVTALFQPGDEAGNGQVGGTAACNNYFGTYTADNQGNLSFESQMGMTMMACPEPAGSLEQTYLAAFGTAESFDILGEQMVIHTGNGDILYTADREPLQGTLWTLTTWGAADNQTAPPDGSDFTAVFDRVPGVVSGIMSGTTGCNDYNATYASNLNEIKVNLPQKSNNESCPGGDAFWEAEQQYFLGLNAASSYRILGNLLQIPYGELPNQQVLTFEGTPIPVEEALDLTPLNGTFWYLQDMGGAPILSGTEVTAHFDINEDGVTGEIEGSSGCNGYNAPLGENFVVGSIVTTKKACQQPIMDQETLYLGWLQSAQGYSRAGDQLLIPTASGVLTFNSTPIVDQAHLLQNVIWYLISYETLTPVAGANPTAIFAADGRSFSGSTGCNDLNGIYKTEQGNTLAISDLATTNAACASDQLTKQDGDYKRLLISAVSYAVNGQSMQITTVDGGTMNFSSIPPAAPVGPTAVINAPSVIEVGQPLAFDGAGSATGSSPIIRYEWNMGDGAQLTGAIVQYTYNTPGSYSVVLTVVDAAGQSSQATHAVTVNAVQQTPPTAVIEGPTSSFVGDQVTFSAAGSQQGSSAITSYAWQSGAGHDTGPVGENSLTTVYSQPGTYYPAVTVADANGLSGTASMAIVVHATLNGTAWHLNSALPGTTISLQFGNGTLSGFSGCNEYNASYTTTLAAGNTNSIQIGNINGTQKLCPEDIMAQESTYLASLQSASQYTIDGTILTLTTTSGVLTYSAAVAVPLPQPVTTQ